MTDEPDNSTLIYKYLTKYTGGSIRHSKINCIDVNSALADLYDDMEKYYEEKILELEKDKQQRIYNWNQLNEQFGRLLNESESKDKKILEFIEELKEEFCRCHLVCLTNVKCVSCNFIKELANEFGFTNHTPLRVKDCLSNTSEQNKGELRSDTDSNPSVSEVNNLGCGRIIMKGIVRCECGSEIGGLCDDCQAKQEKENSDTVNDTVNEILGLPMCGNLKAKCGYQTRKLCKRPREFKCNFILIKQEKENGSTK